MFESKHIVNSKLGSFLFKIFHIIFALCIGVAASSEAHAQRAPEYEVKAAFLYNFTRFVSWPDTAFANAMAPLVIGVFGPNPFGSALAKTIEGKTTQAHPIIVQRFSKTNETDRCHILFIGSSDPRELSRILEHLKSSPVLTVGEQDRFCQTGGMVNFILAGRNVRFEMNPDAIDRAALSISSRLLKLAKIVKDK